MLITEINISCMIAGVMKLMNEFQDLLAEKQNEKKNPDELETPSLLVSC